MIDRHGITIFYTAPTAIRAFMRWGDNYVLRHRLTSLRLLGSVGEPINPEAWMWYHRLIGKKRCPIVDTWWQTETGSIMITPLPGVTPLKPGSGTLPFFGVVPKVVDEKGKEVPRNSRRQTGHHQAVAVDAAHVLGRRRALPKNLLWRVPRHLLHRRRRPPGQGWLFLDRRADRRRAQRLRPPDRHRRVGERARLPSAGGRGGGGGPADELKGQAIVAFVTLKAGNEPSDELKETLRAHVGKEIGSLAKPDFIRFAAGLPKTRSGKIMRRILKEIAGGGQVKGDTTTMEDFTVVAALQADE
jgi:acetyl-CoA synthetase